jgi:broad specificity phosphatase PhoE
VRLLLCRHAEPEAAARGRVCGRLDVGLSPSGEVQADVLAAALASEHASALYASPIRRAVETAGRIGTALGLEPRVDPRLRELDFGQADGLTYEEVEERWPELYETWMRTPTEVRFPAGESFADLKRRAVAAAADIVAAHEDETVVIVAHAGVIRAVLVDWLSMPDEALFRIEQRYASVNVVEVTDGAVNVRLVNGSAAEPAPE